MMTKREIKKLLFTGAFVFALSMLPFALKAQIPDPAVDVDTPIDGGVSILVAAGIGYGIKKYKDGQKAKESSID